MWHTHCEMEKTSRKHCLHKRVCMFAREATVTPTTCVQDYVASSWEVDTLACSPRDHLLLCAQIRVIKANHDLRASHRNYIVWKWFGGSLDMICWPVERLWRDSLQVSNLDVEVQICAAEGSSVHRGDSGPHAKRGQDVLLHRFSGCCS